MAQHALVYGGCGSLGSEAIRQFKTAGLKTISVDFAVSKEADHSIQIQGKSLDEDVKSILAEITKLNTGSYQFISTFWPIYHSNYELKNFDRKLLALFI